MPCRDPHYKTRKRHKMLPLPGFFYELQATFKTKLLLCQIKPVQVHHLGPGGNKVLHKFLPGISAGIYFSQGP